MFNNILLMIGAIVLTVAIAAAQKFLGTRKAWQLGAIIPIMTVVIISILFYTITISNKTILSCVIMIVLELLVWIDGRREHKQNELNKMMAKDIQ